MSVSISPLRIDREKVITVAVAVAGVGALILLQRLTTPHRRTHPQLPPTSSLNLSGRGLSAHHAHHPHAGAVIPNGTPGAAAPGAVGHDRRSASRHRPSTGSAAAKAGAPRSRSHPNPQMPPHTPHRSTEDAGKTRRSSRAASTTARGSHAARLTIESLSEHRRRVGTMHAVRERLSSPDPDAHHQFPVSTSPEKVTDAELEERLAELRARGQAHRTSSNVATVGSTSMEGARAAAAAGVAVTALRLRLPAATSPASGDVTRAESVRDTSPAAPRTARAKRVPVSTAAAMAATTPPAATATPTTGEQVVGPTAVGPGETSPTVHRHSTGKGETHTAVGGSTEEPLAAMNRATQTGLIAPPSLLETTQTPRGARTRPVAAGSGEAEVSDRSELGLSPIVEVNTTGVLRSAAPTPVQVAPAHGASPPPPPLPSPGRSPRELSDGESPEDRTFIPRYLIVNVEQQLRAIIASLYTTAPHNAWTWMVLYCYVKELPPAALAMVRERMRLPDLPTRAADEASASAVEGLDSLEAETTALLAGNVAAIDTTPHYFKWKGSRIVRREGDYAVALANKLQANRAKSFRTGRFDHLLIKGDEADGEAAGYGLGTMTPTGEDSAWGAPGATDADRTAAVTKRYGFVLMRGASTQTESAPVPPSSSATAVAGDAVTNGSVHSDYRTPPHQEGAAYRGVRSSALEADQLRSEQVSGLLQRLVAMRASPDFDLVRHGRGSALFACDFIEVAAEAQRLLDRSHAQPPTTGKVVQPAQSGEDDAQAPGMSSRSSFLSQGSGPQPVKPALHNSRRSGTSSRSVIRLGSVEISTPSPKSNRAGNPATGRALQARGTTAK